MSGIRKLEGTENLQPRTVTAKYPTCIASAIYGCAIENRRVRHRGFHRAFSSLEFQFGSHHDSEPNGNGIS